LWEKNLESILHKRIKAKSIFKLNYHDVPFSYLKSIDYKFSPIGTNLHSFTNDSILINGVQYNWHFNKNNRFKEALQVYVSEFEKYTFNDTQNRFMLVPVIPSKLTDYQLQRYYRELTSLDTNVIDNKHYIDTHNEMIKRGMFGNKVIQPKFEKVAYSDLLTRKEKTHTIKVSNYYNSMQLIKLSDDVYTVDEEYVDETGEFKTMNVVKTASQLGF